VYGNKGNITNEWISINAIRSDRIAANQITAVKINSAAIEARHIKAGVIDTSHVSANSIATSHLQANSITANEINARVVDSSHIGVGTLQVSHSLQVGATGFGRFYATLGGSSSPKLTLNDLVNNSVGLEISTNNSEWLHVIDDDMESQYFWGEYYCHRHLGSTWYYVDGQTTGGSGGGYLTLKKSGSTKLRYISLSTSVPT